MTTVNFHKQNKKQLKEYDGETYNDKVSNLIDMVENKLPVVEVDYSPSTSIYLNDDTLDRLDSYRLTDGESIENIIMRMMILSKTINTTTD